MLWVNFELAKNSCTCFMEPYVSGVLCEKILSFTNF